jgi:hypothetical protein
MRHWKIALPQPCSPCTLSQVRLSRQITRIVISTDRQKGFMSEMRYIKARLLFRTS